MVIGGTLLEWRSQPHGGNDYGVLILGLIQTLITFKGDPNSWWTRIVVGLLVLLFIVLQNVVTSASGRWVRKTEVRPAV